MIEEDNAVVDALRHLADMVEHEELDQDHFIYYLAKIGMLVDADSVRIIRKSSIK